jgi:hypothetical protein
MNPLKQKQAFRNYPQPGPAFPYTVDFILRGVPERYVYHTLGAAACSMAGLIRNGATAVTLTAHHGGTARVLDEYENYGK